MGELKMTGNKALPLRRPFQWNDLFSWDVAKHCLAALALAGGAWLANGAVTAYDAFLVALIFMGREAEQEHAQGGWRWRPWEWSWHRTMEWAVPALAAGIAALCL